MRVNFTECFSFNFPDRLPEKIRQPFVDAQDTVFRVLETEHRGDKIKEDPQLGFLPLKRAVGQLQFLRPLVQPRQRFRQLRATAARGQQHEHECAKGYQAVHDSKYDGGVPDRAEAGKRRIGLCAGKLVAEFFQGVRGGIHALRLRRDVMVH